MSGKTDTAGSMSRLRTTQGSSAMFPKLVRAVTIVAVLSSVVVILAWIYAGLTMGWDSPWWLWVVGSWIPIVGGLWWTMRSENRPQRAPRRSAGGPSRL